MVEEVILVEKSHVFPLQRGDDVLWKSKACVEQTHTITICILDKPHMVAHEATSLLGNVFMCDIDAEDGLLLSIICQQPSNHVSL